MSQTNPNNPPASGQDEQDTQVIYPNNDNLNSTLRKLDSTLEQQTAAAVSSMNLPFFAGAAQEDVHEFLGKFKLATFALSDQHKCLALNKSLCGTANVWAKANIKSLIQDGNWKSIKRLLIDRFGSSDTALRYRMKLNEMNYDANKSTTLLGYVEMYLKAYSKAYLNQNVQDGILSLKINLPNNIIKNLNMLDDKWSEYQNHGELFALIKRYEKNILPYESSEEHKDKYLNGKLIMDMLSQIRKERLEDAKETKAALAVMAVSKSTEKPMDLNRYRYQNPKFKYFKRPNYSRESRNDNQRYDPKRPRLDASQALATIKELKISDQPSTSKDRAQEFKVPPYPCRFCNKMHYHRDCPKHLN